MAGVDLEKELTCSICTEILYQPLTLLDCLHTFCGFCLKQWFEWQTAHPSSPHSFTCPSCRAPVREAKPNATVTTLLDMFLQAEPTRGKSESDKKDIAKSYKPGDAVLPQIPTIQPDEEEEEDRRIIEEVRELSLREVGISEPTIGSNYAARERNRNIHGREEDSDGRRRRGHRRDGSDSLTPNVSGNSPGHSWSRSGTRQVEHQSSLRDLLSAHDLDSGELEEIMRQIMEGGYLDRIDLANIDVAQEDEISERIAEAYRQRQRQREQARSNPESTQHRRPRTHMRSRSGAVQSGDEASRSSPRTHLEVMPDSGGRRRRASANSRSETLPHARSSPGPRSSADLPQRAGHSSTDLSDRPQSGTPLTGTAAPGRQIRSSTEPDRRRRTEHTRRDVSGESRDRSARHGSSDSHAEPQTNSTPDISTSTGDNPRSVRARTQQPVVVPPPQTLQIPDSQRGRAGSRHKVNSRSSVDPEIPPSSSASSVPRSALYREPSISCNSCNRAHIEYSLHYNCSKCNGGNYNLCISCFRLNKGCLQWYGFGYAALSKYLRAAPAEGYPPDHPRPHKLTGQRYLRPNHDPLQHPGAEIPSIAPEDSLKRLQKGVFCDICFSLANECYWRCDLCNEGDWGFCNSCVNKGQCCTHSLLPTRYKRTALEELPQGPPASESHMPASMSPPEPLDFSEDGLLVPIMFTTRCNICKLSIPPSHTHLHCLRCNDGDYDICNNCYHDLSTSGRISQENGQNGWRRCPRGHRMIVVGFEDYDGEQRRIVVKDLVGGVALDESGADGTTDGGNATNADRVYSWREPDGRVESRTFARRVTSGTTRGAAPITTQFPPSGGVGMRVFAVWSYFPVDFDARDLTFPRGAEIREVDNMNEDWFWGCYAGSKGMFPAQHVRLL